MKEVQLSRGLIAIVDDWNFSKVTSGNKWWALKGRDTFYAARQIWVDGKKITQLLHRIIKEVEDTHVQVDHISGNGLDCREENLRIATHTQNQANRALNKNSTSKLKGVSWNKARGLWLVRIGEEGTYLGYFSSKREAAMAYNKEAVIRYGEFAQLNKV